MIASLCFEGVQQEASGAANTAAWTPEVVPRETCKPAGERLILKGALP